MTEKAEIPALARRRAQRADLLERARVYARDLTPALDVQVVVVFGSVARGDFNVWSDVDVLVVARQLPTDWKERQALVESGRPPRVSPLAWSPDELRREVERRNPIATEALERGVFLVGDRAGLERLATGREPPRLQPR